MINRFLEIFSSMHGADGLDQDLSPQISSLPAMLLL